jgi:hypothetical protein
MMDWPANTDPEFAEHRLFHPAARGVHAVPSGVCEKWVVYSTPHYSAKELTVLPGPLRHHPDAAAYGLILTQGYGTIGKHEVETPSLIRYGQMTQDELFVTKPMRPRTGVAITNTSETENLVMLKHFGPNNADAPGKKIS